MSMISPVAFGNACTCSCCSPQPRKMPERRDILQREYEEAVILAKQKKDGERTFEDYLALTVDSMQKILTPVVCHANNTNVDFMA